MNDYYVYGYYEPGAEKPFYIGKGKGNRRYAHLQNSESQKKNTLLHNKLRKMKREGVTPEIDILFDSLTEAQAFSIEISLIKAYGRRNIRSGTLCNMTDGGEGTSNRLISDQLRNQYRDARLGIVASTDTRIKMSKAQKKIKRSTSHLRKCAQAGLLTAIPICSFNLVTKGIVKIYPSIKSVITDGYSRTGVRAVICGKKPQIYNLGWRYLTPEESEAHRASKSVQKG